MPSYKKAKYIQITEDNEDDAKDIMRHANVGDIIRYNNSYWIVNENHKVHKLKYKNFGKNTLIIPYFPTQNNNHQKFYKDIIHKLKDVIIEIDRKDKLLSSEYGSSITSKWDYYVTYVDRELYAFTIDYGHKKHTFICEYGCLPDYSDIVKHDQSESEYSDTSYDSRTEYSESELVSEKSEKKSKKSMKSKKHDKDVKSEPIPKTKSRKDRDVESTSKIRKDRDTESDHDNEKKSEKKDNKMKSKKDDDKDVDEDEEGGCSIM